MTLFPIEPRPPDELLASGLAVIDSAFAAGAAVMAPLFSSGNDSHCACHVASRHPQFGGEVHFINTGIGARAARDHAEEVCRLRDWAMRVWTSAHTYERFVRERGFPGPGRHHWIYVRIKERCVRQILKGRGKTALVTGCRSEESVRRMGHVEPLKVGEVRQRKGKTVTEEKNRFWTAPCHDWTAEEQALYMVEFDLPRNPVKERLGVSGECFCGAFATPGELERVRLWVPDVAEKIDRLTEIARACGTHDAWGTRPPDDGRGLLTVRTGELCSGCDRRAYAAGLLFGEPPEETTGRAS